ncbi:hypothetical protein [Vibrio aestuarianus]|nr:hypothetical protein [Vibrio aestuarianus]MDE1239160.1 hypothetical protein [Vibrio aestuarianus]
MVQRAEDVIFAVARMTEWVNLNAQMKTAIAYRYDPNFCTMVQSSAD